MSTPESEGQATKRLASLRLALLRLHKVLLDDERAAYERARGRVSAGEMLQLVISDEQFAWLHSISELIVSIDELLDAEEPATTEAAESLFAQARLLLKPSETGSEFAQKYYATLQREPDAVLAHREVTTLLKQVPDERRT
ncbi:MAG TPA: hypothetical protein VJT74_09030 [Pyrinomonadaceae bacterium]|nr:hypothetical protein [Pyrinomonadaceae bacterium]